MPADNPAEFKMKGNDGHTFSSGIIIERILKNGY